jgi:hypothetical protein
MRRPRYAARRPRRPTALERMTQSLERNRYRSNAERIALMRKVYFADVDAAQKELVLPG